MTVQELIDKLSEFPGYLNVGVFVYRELGGGAVECPDTAELREVSLVDDTVSFNIETTDVGDEPLPEAVQ